MPARSPRYKTGAPQKGERWTHRLGPPYLGQALRLEMAEQIREPEGGGEAAEILRRAASLGQVQKLPVLFGRHPGEEEVPGTTRVVQEGHHSVAGSRQRPGRGQDPLHHRGVVEALVDAQAGLAQPGQALRGTSLSRSISSASLALFF